MKDKVLLIIEDDPNFASTLMKIARKRGYKCLAAGDGTTGLMLAVEPTVTAIILGLKLPDIDGLRVLDQLKHNLRTRHIPVHIISGREEGTETVVSLRMGAIGYLTKPVAPEAIDAALASIETLLCSEVRNTSWWWKMTSRRRSPFKHCSRKRILISRWPTRDDAGLKHAGEQAFDCMILDLQFPDMIGSEWLEKVEGTWARTCAGHYLYRQRAYRGRPSYASRYTSSIIMKGGRSSERLLDEVTLFLHSMESTLSKDQQDIIRMQHNPDRVLQGRTLLLVDDDLRNTFALSKLLKQHGLNIVIADNGQMALDKLKEDRSIELVIMDIMMPVMDGYQAMREIRAQPSLASIPLIALTARAMPEEQNKCIAAGANDYLTKPVDMERLLTLLRVWLFRQEVAA
ncbi:MAG: response regulator [Nitrospira sp.]